MKILDIEKWNRKKHFENFSKYKLPYYTLSVRLNMTKFLKTVKMNNLRFFPSFIYLLLKVVNEFEGLKLRFNQEGQVCLYDNIDVSYTVLLNDNNFEFCLSKYYNDFYKFYNNVVTDLDDVKTKNEFNGTEIEAQRSDVIHCSCLPFIDLEEYSNPLPLGDQVEMSIPKINWGKCSKKDDKYDMFISFTVNHALIDGYELSMAINRLQQLLDEFDPNY